MHKEIGSEFWIDQVPTEYKSGLPQWVGKFGNIVLTSSGRGAISLMLEKTRKKTALLPAYTCDSMILPFIAQGYDCRFYDVNRDLTPDL